MNGTPSDFENVAKDKSVNKPFDICEFAHAMFKLMGLLQKYSDFIDKNTEIAGASMREISR